MYFYLQGYEVEPYESKHISHDVSVKVIAIQTQGYSLLFLPFSELIWIGEGKAHTKRW